MSFSLKPRSHCLFLQNSYCVGVQCACFSKDDKYVYAGLKDRSIIVWSVLDGESFCFEGRTELRSGDKRPCSGSLPLEGSALTSLHLVHLLGGQVSAASGNRPNWSYTSSSRTHALKTWNSRTPSPPAPEALFRASVGLFPRSILLKVGYALSVHTLRL